MKYTTQRPIWDEIICNIYVKGLRPLVNKGSYKTRRGVNKAMNPEIQEKEQNIREIFNIISNQRNANLALGCHVPPMKCTLLLPTHPQCILKYYVFCFGEGVKKKDPLFNLSQNYK